MPETKPLSSRTSYRIHQTVHGYDRGHRLLATSFSMDDASDLLMGSMSDLLTTRLLEDDGSYLVGYPLKLENAYVVARTWTAREMRRPGSVWTHSLIIDYQTLALLDDPTCLLGLLRRPSVEALKSYFEPILVKPSTLLEPDQLSKPHSRAAVISLYSLQPSRVVVLGSKARDEDERLLLALWRQMWPALRRESAFFSFADEPHSSVDAACVIHFASTHLQGCGSDDSSDAEAINAMAADLPYRQQTKLRGFVARHAFDAAVPRAAVLPLVHLWEGLNRRDRVSALHALAELLPQSNPSRLLRTVLEYLSERASEGAVLLEIVERFGGLEVVKRSDWLTPSAKWASDQHLGKVLDLSGENSQGTLGAAIFDDLATTTPIENLAIASYNEKTASSLIRQRPELLDERSFWDRQKQSQATLVRMAAAIGRPLGSVLALVYGTTSIETVAALLECWPDRIPETTQRFISIYEGKRLIGAALGRSRVLLERTLDANAPLDDDLIDEIIGQGFAVDAIGLPPAGVWNRLAKLGGPRHGPNQAVLSFIIGMTSDGPEGRRMMAHLLPVIREMVRAHRISHGANQQLNQALRSKKIYNWSVETALAEAVVVAFTDGWHVSTDILAAVDGAEIEGIFAAIHGRLGMSEVRDLRSRAMHGRGHIEPWKLRKLEEFIKANESRWFW